MNTYLSGNGLIRGMFTADDVSRITEIVSVFGADEDNVDVYTSGKKRVVLHIDISVYAMYVDDAENALEDLLDYAGEHGLSLSFNLVDWDDSDEWPRYPDHYIIFGNECYGWLDYDEYRARGLRAPWSDRKTGKRGEALVPWKRPQQRFSI